MNFADWTPNISPDFLGTFSETEQKKIAAIFEQLQLPIPKEGSFLPGTEGALIFHTDAGIVIRVEAKNTRIMPNRFYETLCKMLDLNYDIIKAHFRHMMPERFVHDHILQPIVSIPVEDHIIEIVPGLRLGVSDADVAQMTRHLKQSGIDFWDGKSTNAKDPILRMISMAAQKQFGVDASEVVISQGSANSAYLPIKTPEFPRGYPVIADRMAAGWIPILHDQNSFLGRALGSRKRATHTAPIQEKLYAPLRTAFAQAWDSNTLTANPEKMKVFWETCKEFTQRKTEIGEPFLKAGWADKETRNEGLGGLKSNSVNEIAAQYWQQLRSAAQR